MVDSIQQVVDRDMCISCGACTMFADGENSAQVRMVELKSKGIYVPTIEQKENGWGKGVEFSVCPGKGYPIVKMAEELFPEAPNLDTDLGRWNEVSVARSLSSELIENASSGGVMTAIAQFLLENDVVQGVVTTRMKYSSCGPRPESFIAESIAELKEAQGSKYCPVPVFGDIKNLLDYSGKLLFIGTPCQIAALRLAQAEFPQLKEKVPLTIGNFCGGYRDLRETDKIIRRSGVAKEKVEFLRYRGGGQPGSMLIRAGDQERELSYPGYARMTGVVKYQRCRLCVDATAELSDFSCGDAWIPEYVNSGLAWSIVLTRSELARSVFKQMHSEGKVERRSVAVEDVKKSQKGNLSTKKSRQACRIRLYKLLGKDVPEFDGGFYSGSSGVGLELKVHVSHMFFAFLERIGLYKLFSKIIGRYPK